MAVLSTMTRPPAGSTWRGPTPSTRPTTQHPGKKIGSWKENEVGGFVVFSQKLFSYF